MRQITSTAIAAFDGNKSFGGSNTTVTVSGDTTRLYLFGNLIAIKCNNVTTITNAGWFSVIIKERLNGLSGVSIQQKKGDWYLNGELWDGSWIRIS